MTSGNYAPISPPGARRHPLFDARATAVSGRRRDANTGAPAHDRRPPRARRALATAGPYKAWRRGGIATFHMFDAASATADLGQAARLSGSSSTRPATRPGYSFDQASRRRRRESARAVAAPPRDHRARRRVHLLQCGSRRAREWHARRKRPAVRRARQRISAQTPSRAACKTHSHTRAAPCRDSRQRHSVITQKIAHRRVSGAPRRSRSTTASPEFETRGRGNRLLRPPLHRRHESMATVVPQAAPRRAGSSRRRAQASTREIDGIAKYCSVSTAFWRC